MEREEKKERDRRLDQVIDNYDITICLLISAVFRLAWNLSQRYSRDKNKNQ